MSSPVSSHHTTQLLSPLPLSFASLLFSNVFFKSFLDSSQSLGPYNIVYLYCNFYSLWASDLSLCVLPQVPD